MFKDFVYPIGFNGQDVGNFALGRLFVGAGALRGVVCCHGDRNNERLEIVFLHMDLQCIKKSFATCLKHKPLASKTLMRLIF